MGHGHTERSEQVACSIERSNQRYESDSRGLGIWPSAQRSGDRFFLGQYHFDADAEIEPIEISKDGVFEFYLFAVSNRLHDDVSLLAMWPQPKPSTEEPG